MVSSGEMHTIKNDKGNYRPVEACVRCGYVREVRYGKKRPNFTGLCRDCYILAGYLNRPRKKKTNESS